MNGDKEHGGRGPDLQLAVAAACWRRGRGPWQPSIAILTDARGAAGGETLAVTRGPGPAAGRGVVG
jgi:hypothetical protein